jgi:hypothetical protein
MNWREFISSIVGALAWPAALFAVLYVLRKPLGTLLTNFRPKQARYRGLEVDFASEVEEAEELAEAAELPATGTPIGGPENAPRHAMLVREAPRAAVLETWLGVEAEMKRLGEIYGVRPSVHALKAEGAISAELGALIRQLRELRNEAVHRDEFAVTQEEAERYAETAAALLPRFASRARQPRKGCDREAARRTHRTASSSESPVRLGCHERTRTRWI